MEVGDSVIYSKKVGEWRNVSDKGQVAITDLSQTLTGTISQVVDNQADGQTWAFVRMDDDSTFWALVSDLTPTGNANASSL